MLSLLQVNLGCLICGQDAVLPSRSDNPYYSSHPPTVHLSLVNARVKPG